MILGDVSFGIVSGGMTFPESFFFHEQNIPVMFQFADYKGADLEGRFGDIENEIKNRKDENGNFIRIPNKAGSAITRSEMRHAIRMQKRLDLDFDLNLIHGGNKI